MPGFPSSPVPSSPASACQLWLLLLLLAWPLRRCFWERRALSPKPWSCSGVWGSPGRQPGCWEWGTAPKIPPAPGLVLALAVARSLPNSPQHPTDSSSRQKYGISPLPRAVQLGLCGYPRPRHTPARLRRPLTAGASAPAGTRASAGAGCVQVGACHGQDFSSVPRKHASPSPSVLGSSSHNPKTPLGSPVAPQPAQPRALGSLRGCPARWC